MECPRCATQMQTTKICNGCNAMVIGDPQQQVPSELSAGLEYAAGEGLWVIGEQHPIYGEVSMMGNISGEKYRWFTKDNLVSMIPLEMC